MPTDEPDVVPLQDAAEATGFDVVIRGYDRRQVDLYLDRVDVALTEADQRHGDDEQRAHGLQRELAGLRERLELAEARAEGKPEPASLVGERRTAHARTRRSGGGAAAGRRARRARQQRLRSRHPGQRAFARG